MPVFGTIVRNSMIRHQSALPVLPTKSKQRTGLSWTQTSRSREMSEKVFCHAAQPYTLPGVKSREQSQLRSVGSYAKKKSLQKLYAIQNNWFNCWCKPETRHHQRSSTICAQPRSKIGDFWMNGLPNWKIIKSPFSNSKCAIKKSNQTHRIALALTDSKISLPRYEALGDLLSWMLQEKMPGEFPYTSGIYPFKREAKIQHACFVGEGTAERTNRRFHYVSLGMPAKRLSTVHLIPVTLYGNNPWLSPRYLWQDWQIGVSICCLMMRRNYTAVSIFLILQHPYRWPSMVLRPCY